MAWFDKSQNQENKYTYVARVEVDYGYGYSISNRVPKTYSMRAGNLGFKFAKKLFKKLIEYIDDDTFVDLKKVDNNDSECNPANMRCGMVKLISEYNFFILTEDIEKVGTEDPVHIVCLAEEYPNEKAEFISILEILSR